MELSGRLTYTETWNIRSVNMLVIGKPQSQELSPNSAQRTFLASLRLLTVVIISIAPGIFAPTEAHGQIEAEHLNQIVAQTSPGASNTRTTESPETKKLKVDVGLVLVPVSVTDQHDRPVMGLTKDNFVLYEGNEVEVISHLSNEDTPISLGVIFDTSESMYGKIEKSREAVIQFLRSANPQDEFFLVTFSNSPKVVVHFTNSVDDIQTEITKATPNGVTGLLDAVYLGLDVMKTARNQRKALLIVSDGGDNHSRYTARDVILAVREADLQIYAMGIFDEAPRTKAERAGPDLLKAITNVTGGRTFPIHNIKKLRESTDELAIELRNQYVIAYRPRNLVYDGKWHKISVRVIPPQDSPKLHVYARTGYYAPTN